MNQLNDLEDKEQYELDSQKLKAFNAKEDAIGDFENFLHDGLKEFIYQGDMDESELNHVLRKYNEYLLKKIKESVNNTV